MAIYPCQVGKHRYPQPQQSGYYSILQGRDVATWRGRLCPSHFREVWAVAQVKMDNVTEGGQSSMACQLCQEPRETTAFLRLFPAKSEEVVYALDTCRPCAGILGVDLGVPDWDRLESSSLTQAKLGGPASGASPERWDTWGRQGIEPRN